MELSPAECVNRLRSASWGRVALSMQTIAMVIPVPVGVLGDRVVFATTRGSTFDRAVQGQPISVQAEGREPGPDGRELLWSVVVSGICLPDEPALLPAGLLPSSDLAGVRAGVVAGAPERDRWNAVPFSLVQGWSAPVPPRPAPLRRGHDGGAGAG